METRRPDGTALNRRVFVNRFSTVRIDMEAAIAKEPPVITPPELPTARDGWFAQSKAGMSVIVQNSIDAHNRSITGPTFLDAQMLAGFGWQAQRLYCD